MKKLVLIISCILITLFAFGSFISASQSQLPSDVLKAEEEGLSFFKTKVSQNPQQFGFNSVDEVNKVTLGEGFNVLFLNQEKLKSKETDSLLELTDASTMYEFAVELDGKAKTFLTIGLEDGAYKVVHFGGNAQVFGDTFKKFKDLNKTLRKPALVKIGSSYCFVDKTNAHELVLPAVSSAHAESLGGMDNSVMKQSKDLVKYLKAMQKNSKGDKTRGGI